MPSLIPPSSPAVLNFPPAVDEYGMVVRPLFGGPFPVIIIPPLVTISTVTLVPAAAVSTLLLAANPARGKALFLNYSSSRFLYLKLGLAASLVSFTTLLGPRGHFELDLPIWTGVVTGLWSAGVGGACLVTELT